MLCTFGFIRPSNKTALREKTNPFNNQQQRRAWELAVVIHYNLVMSMVSVYRSVPSPQSDLYRYPRASDLCNRIQGEESKMNLPAGIPSILSPPTEKSQHPVPGGDNVRQHEINQAIASPQPAGQFVPQLPKVDSIDHSIKPVSHLLEDTKDRFTHHQNQVSQDWSGGDSTMNASGPTPPDREPEIVGEENDEDLGEEFSNGEEAEGGHSKSGGDAGDDKKKTKGEGKVS